MLVWFDSYEKYLGQWNNDLQNGYGVEFTYGMNLKESKNIYVIVMLVNGVMGKEMDMEYFFIVMVVNMKGNGKRILVMGWAL